MQPATESGHGDGCRAHTLAPDPTPEAPTRSPALGLTLPLSRLVARLGDLLRQLVQNRGPLPACTTMITGLSASADIVDVRTFGVHGPGEVHVWIIENE